MSYIYNIMLKKDTIHAYVNWFIEPHEIAERSEKLLWSNCETIQLLSFNEDGRTIYVLVKKSRLSADKLESVREEYRKLKRFLWGIIPMQAFVSEKNEWWRQLITAFCSPVSIAYDIFKSDENFDFLTKEIERNHELQNDINLFVEGYSLLAWEWFFIDLYWEENLVITREWRLKYIDSFIADISKRISLRNASQSRFEKLKKLSTSHNTNP